MKHALQPVDLLIAMSEVEFDYGMGKQDRQRCSTDVMSEPWLLRLLARL